MATEAARLKRKNPLVRKRKTDLTLTGLLMEGLGQHNRADLPGACFDARFVVSSPREAYDARDRGSNRKFGFKPFPAPGASGVNSDVRAPSRGGPVSMGVSPACPFISANVQSSRQSAMN
jgi:hypothetical protein